MSFHDIDILLRLIVAHLFTDFVFQPKKWVNEKNKKHWKSKNLYFHVLISGILTYLFLGKWENFEIPLIIAVSHFFIDITKTYFKDDNIWFFITDQFAHILVILFVWLGYTGQFNEINAFFNEFAVNTKIWWVISGYIFMTTPLSIFISIITKRWSGVINNNEESSLKDAGKWIGIIERILIFTFIIVGRIEVIGFVLAAKSVFRFGDLKENKDRKKTEYILIGTLISFTLSIIIGLIIKLFI